MEIREEWNFRDRTGDRTFDRSHIKRTPLEKFQMTASLVFDKIPSLVSEKRQEWFENNIIIMPSFSFLSPVGVVFGYACIDPTTQKIDKKKFIKIESLFRNNTSWIKSFGVSLVDVVRYARLWENWLSQNGVFSTSRT